MSSRFSPIALKFAALHVIHRGAPSMNHRMSILGPVNRGVSSLDFPEHSTRRERATLTRDYVTRVVQKFIKRPCVDPACRCRIHEVLPAVEVMLELREDEQHNKQTKLGKKFDAPDEERLKYPTWK